MTEARSGFPWWIVVGGCILALGYLPTLNAPFDFTDDGNLVYPAEAGTTLGGHVGLWWDKVQANVEHLGPFRPVVWAHWELAANTFGADPVAWRAGRLVWCGLAAVMLLWLLRELKLHPTAALVAGAAAMWNPYRNEIWTSLTLAEGVAMPYALLALVAARRRWDVVAVASLLAALGCKNVFVAIVPAMLALRLWPDSVSWREGWRQNRGRAALYLLPLALPLAHMVYFKLTWHAGQYETPGPSWEQVGRIGSWMKGAMGLDFLGVGLAVTLVAVWTTFRREFLQQHRAALLTGALLFVAGVLVYVPVAIMAARYTMPAVWGFDVLFALVLTAFLALPLTWTKRLAWVGLCVGLAAMMLANVSRQEKVIARSRMLWDTLEHLERTAPPGARVAWIGGDTGPRSLNIEEGIHFHWHLLHRGRGDIRVGLFDANGQPVARVELPPLDGEPIFRIAGEGDDTSRWKAERTFTTAYRMGSRRYECRLEARPSEPGYDDAALAAFLRMGLGAESDAELKRRLQGQPEGQRPTAELKR